LHQAVSASIHKPAAAQAINFGSQFALLFLCSTNPGFILCKLLPSLGKPIAVGFELAAIGRNRLVADKSARPQ
jgi:hypothetical protein